MIPAQRRLPISLVIPAFRAERFIARAIESAAYQDAVPAEIIVVDDASDDRTGEAARAAGATVVRLPHNGGPSAARNAGVAAAREPWIAFLDADDAWLYGKLAAQWDALQRWPDTGFCFTDYDVVEANGHALRGETAADPGYALVRPAERYGDAVRFLESGFVPGLVRSMFIRQSSAIVNRALFLTAGGYDPALRLGEDYDFFLRLCGLAPVAAIERSYVTYLRQPRSLSADPLAEVRAIDRLWTSILDRPQRYPHSAVESIRRERHLILRYGSARALRLGRFGAAAALARRTIQFERTHRDVAMLALAMALDNQAGHALYAAARALWRKRPGSLQPPRPAGA